MSQKRNFLKVDFIMRHQSIIYDWSSFLTAPLITRTPYGNLEILTHIPRSPTTAAAFQQFAANNQTLQLASWPNKEI